jgi:hypothetical protein
VVAAPERDELVAEVDHPLSMGWNSKAPLDVSGWLLRI